MNWILLEFFSTTPSTTNCSLRGVVIWGGAMGAEPPGKKKNLGYPPGQIRDYDSYDPLQACSRAVTGDTWERAVAHGRMPLPVIFKLQIK